MADISTPLHLHSRSASTAAAAQPSPAKASLMFIRQFARCYSPLIGGMILN